MRQAVQSIKQSCIDLQKCSCLHVYESMHSVIKDVEWLETALFDIIHQSKEGFIWFFALCPRMR